MPPPKDAAALPQHQQWLAILREKQGNVKEMTRAYTKAARTCGNGASTVTAAKANAEKNRYTNILPFDENRVVLSNGGYINASHMSLPNAALPWGKRYIACQGPLPHTIEDFWRMVWGERVGIVVMLTREKDKQRAKCARYWPKDTLSFPDAQLQVTLQAERSCCHDTCTERLFRVERLANDTPQADERGAALRVLQYAYHDWPDHGVPDDATPLLHLRETVHQAHQAQQTSPGTLAQTEAPPPIVVHCSAGVGRTGTFCAIDAVLDMLVHAATRGAEAADGDACDDAPGQDIVLETVKAIRRQRMCSVETRDQFEFCYDAVLLAQSSEG